MTLGYNPGRSHRWELTTRRELNQLSSYQSLALDPFLPNDAQRYAIDSQASWTWQMNRWSSTLSANRSEQIYPQQLARTDRLAHSLSYQSSRTSRITQELSYSQTLNRQAGLTLARRSTAQLRSAYQQSWGGGALAWSRRPFVSAEITGETLDDALTQIPYRRLALLLAIGEN
jgi:hypothetical protein